MMPFLRPKQLAALAVLLLYSAFSIPHSAFGQGLHFSQYFNNPLLSNPANTGLMPDNDYRIGAAYRTQWGAVPVPYHTFSFYGDAQLMRRRNETNWMGLGFVAYSDKAGEGDLALNRYEGFISYHVQLGEKQLISAGASVAYVQRSIDFSKFTWDAQWDGFAFDTRRATNEKDMLSKTTYADLSAGINYAYYPNEFVYIKLSAAATHINQPKETFLGSENAVGIRPLANIDATARVGDYLIINPSVFYTQQKSASELLYGSLFLIRTSQYTGTTSNLIFGAYHRLNDAIVIDAGYEWNGLRVMASYDYTISNLGQYINHNGAAELGVVWLGSYRDEGAARRRAFMCPRF